MSGVHPEHTGEHPDPTAPMTTDGVDFLVVAKDGNNYYPTEPAYYVGGDIFTVIADAEETGGAFGFLDFYVPPHDVFPQHTHAHEAEAKYVLEGEVSFQFGGNSVTAPPGSFVYYPMGRPMGFTATENPARLAVVALPGASYYELAGVAVDGPPPQANLLELQQQVDLGKVAEVNNTYGGQLYIPGDSTSPPSGLLDTVLVVPDASLITDSLREVEGLDVFVLNERPKFTGAFGIEYTSLVSFEETNGNLAYSQFSLAPQSEFADPIVSDNRQTFYVTEGKLSVKIGEEIKVASPDTFVYVSPGQSYSIANLGNEPVEALAATIVDTYVPKIGQYLAGNEEFLATIHTGDEYVQGNVISTEPKAIGDGWVYTWGAFNDESNPTSIGVTFTADAFSNAEGLDMFELEDPNNEFPRSVPHLAMPDMFDPARVYNVAFPDQVLDTTPFNHMGLYANSEGHAPQDIYDSPHLDVHFFISTIAERELITGNPNDNVNLFDTPPAGFLNPDYIAPTVPGTEILATGDALQGIHWVDRDAPEIQPPGSPNAAPFTQTFIFGSYDNKVNFWEPMITQEFLQSLSASGETTKQTYSIKQPARFLEGGYYPLEYSISYNADFQEYTISMDNFVLQEADALVRYGSSGDDIMESDKINGSDTIFLGDGDDFADASQSEFGGNRLYGGRGNDELMAGESDRLFGGNGDDILDATEGEGGNRLYGGKGKDFLLAGSNDRLYGGKGKDTLVAGSGGARLKGGRGKDTFLIANSALPESVNTIVDFNVAQETLVIGGLDLTFDDLTLTRRGKNISISAGDVELAILNKVKFNELSADNFVFVAEGETLDIKNPLPSNGSGSNSRQATVLIANPAGNDTVVGSLAADTLYGNVGGGSSLVGRNGDDILYAGTAGDRLSGGSGVDALVGGGGRDTLTGGTGYDYFIFQQGFPVTVEETELIRGGYGGNDVITDYQGEAGIGDIIKLRNLDNGTGINIRDDGNGNTVITIENRYNIDPTGGSGGTGNYEPILIQTITVEGVTANELMTQGQIEVNDLPLNETTQGMINSFGTFDYVIGGLSATFPQRPGGVAGNSIFGDPFFGQPGVAPENNLVAGDFVAPEKLAQLLGQVAASVTSITIPGTDADLPAELRSQFEAQKVIGTIPDQLLPRNAFSFAFNEAGEVDLSRFSPTFDAATVNDDLIVGGPGNDFLVSGPGNDIIVGGAGTDIIWAGAGQDIVVGREGVDFIIFDSILDFRDRDIVEQDAISTAIPDARLGYIRLEEPYGVDLTDPFTTKTGPDIILINSQAFNRGIDPLTNPELAAQIGYLQPGTIISGDGTGAAATKNGQLNVGQSTVPNSDGPAADDLQPLFYYSPSAGRLFFDRDGTGTMFGDFWMADMGVGVGLPGGAPPAAPDVLLYVY